MFRQDTETRNNLQYIILLLVVVLLTACADSSVQSNESLIEPTPTPTQVPTTGRGVGDTLHILDPRTVDTLNPHLSIATKNAEAARVVYEPLASPDKDGQLMLFLAAEIPTVENGGLAPDLTSVTWKLRDDVKWSDGEPFTADDVLFTYEYISNPDVKAATASTYSAIDYVEVIDPYTVKINFKTSNPAWSLPFVGSVGLIIPRHVFEPYNGSNASQAPANNLPVGTGPYMVIAQDTGGGEKTAIKPQEVLLFGAQLVETRKIEFEPNPNFREADKPYFSRIEWRGGGTANEAARLVLKEGEVDYAYGLDELDSKTLQELETGGQGELATNFGARVIRTLLNRTDPTRPAANGEKSSTEIPHPFFSDKKVRQAFAHAIDRNTIAGLYGPLGEPTTNNLMGPPEYRSPNSFYEYDLNKAAALLDEAGWIDTNGDGIRDKDGQRMKVVFQVQVSDIIQQSQQIIKNALESIGIEVELKIVDSGIMFGSGAANPDSWKRFNADMMHFALRSVNPDPSDYQQFWTCSQIPQRANNWNGLNMERYCSEEYEALFRQAANELDPEKRRELFIQMNDMLVEDVVMIPVVFLADAQGVSRTIEGVDLTPWDKNTWNIKDWRRVTP